MNGRVEVIPVSAWNSLHCNVGASTYQFMKEDDEDNVDSGAYQALTVFCNRYDPATEKTATDYFSSKEIQNLIEEHIGFHIGGQKLYELLVEMKYNYVMRDDEFVWLCKK